MKRIALPLLALLAAVVLAACNVVVDVTPKPPANTVNVTATAIAGDPVDNRTYAPGASQVFRVAVPGTTANSDLIYFELSADVDLEVLPASYATVDYISSSKNLFADGEVGLVSTASGAAEVAPQAIGVALDCRGSCVIVEADSSVRYVRVTNTSGTSQNINLWVYGEAFQDEYEPNDSIGTAGTLKPSDSGAIETVGDVDYFFVPVRRTVMFTAAANGPTIEAYIVDGAGNPWPDFGGPYLDGMTMSLEAGDFLLVKAQDSRLAASPAESLYRFNAP